MLGKIFYKDEVWSIVCCVTLLDHTSIQGSVILPWYVLLLSGVVWLQIVAISMSGSSKLSKETLGM